MTAEVEVGISIGELVLVERLLCLLLCRRARVVYVGWEEHFRSASSWSQGPIE
jgi:hypothetical protein